MISASSAVGSTTALAGAAVALAFGLALALALGRGCVDSLRYLTVSVLAALFVALPLGASSPGGCGGCGGLAGIMASSGMRPVVQGTRVVDLNRGALRARTTLFTGARTGGGGEPMSK